MCLKAVGSYYSLFHHLWYKSFYDQCPRRCCTQCTQLPAERHEKCHNNFKGTVEQFFDPQSSLSTLSTSVLFHNTRVHVSGITGLQIRIQDGKIKITIEKCKENGNNCNFIKCFTQSWTNSMVFTFEPSSLLFFNYRKPFLRQYFGWIRIKKAAEYGPAKNECGSTALLKNLTNCILCCSNYTNCNLAR